MEILLFYYFNCTRDCNLFCFVRNFIYLNSNSLFCSIIIFVSTRRTFKRICFGIHKFLKAKQFSWHYTYADDENSFVLFPVPAAKRQSFADFPSLFFTLTWTSILFCLFFFLFCVPKINGMRRSQIVFSW